VVLKNNLSSTNRSGLEINYTYPLLRHLKGFVQIYSGYGENLIDMENYTNRIGIGIALTDAL
jgi:phospholipase A1